MCKKLELLHFNCTIYLKITMINNSIFREFSSCSILLSSDLEVT